MTLNLNIKRIVIHNSTDTIQMLLLYNTHKICSVFSCKNYFFSSKFLFFSSSSSCASQSLDPCPAPSSPPPGSSSPCWPVSSCSATPSSLISGWGLCWCSWEYSWMEPMVNRNHLTSQQLNIRR